jgi:CRISPR/Cas system CSM-associated protein Csm3 (group 7 of RAMP superfamily)
VAKEHSKFDEEIVYKGTRFKFSIEMIEDDKKSFDNILNLLLSPSFRFGGGTTKGFGKVNILEIKTQSYTKDTYENYSSSLNHSLSTKYSIKKTEAKKFSTYTLKITPDDFFIFGSGFGDSDADSTPIYEKVIDYQNAKLSNTQILIPASSIKGALAHRTVYHYNLQQKLFIGNNEAKATIKELFGEAKNSKEDIEGSKGKILFSDCFKADNNETKTFDHVAIDRFTGGAMSGALFQEKTIADDREYEIEILLENKDIDEPYIKAFESALKDICSGMLPLGGMTTKGHGVFTGELLKDGEKI